jgi:outer membrane protein TolC
MNKSLFILLLFLFFFERNGTSQSLSLDSCQAKAQKAYPLVKKYDLLESSKEYSLANAQKGYLPQISITGYSTYQSEVFQFPFEIPGNEIEPLRNDQHNIYGEVVQPLTGLFTQKNQKTLIDQSNEIEFQRLEVDLYQIKDRVNQLFFGI